MKKSFFFAFYLFCILLCLSSCDEKAQIIESLKPDIESKLRENGCTNFTIEDITLVKESGNTYKGVVKIKESDGTHDYDIEVISDGDSYKWEMPNTPAQRQALKKIQDGLEQVQKEYDKSIDEMQKEYDKSMDELQKEYDNSSDELQEEYDDATSQSNY